MTALPDQCQPVNPCKNGGVCIDDKNGVTYRCKCVDGFSGDKCEICKYDKSLIIILIIILWTITT